MMKDGILYAELPRKLRVSGLSSSGSLASFRTAEALGYAGQISNTVVDTIGDVSGGVRRHDGKDRS